VCVARSDLLFEESYVLDASNYGDSFALTPQYDSSCYYCKRQYFLQCWVILSFVFKSGDQWLADLLQGQGQLAIGSVLRVCTSISSYG